MSATISERSHWRRTLRSVDARTARYIAAKLVVDTPEEMRATPAGRFLMLCYGIDRRGMKKILKGAGVSEIRPLGALTIDERTRLSAELRRRDA